MLFTFCEPLCAGNRFWTGGGANNNWTTAANWSTGAPVAGDDLIFQPNASVDATSLNNTNNYATDTVFGSITFMAGATNYFLNGNRIIFNNSTAPVISGQSGGANTVNLNVQLNANATFEHTAAGAPLQVNGAINLNGYNLTNNVANAAGRMEMGGVISGSGTVTKDGSGTLLYWGPGSNTYTNLTIIKAGTLELHKVFSPAATAIAGDVIVGNGSLAATLRNLDILEIADTSDVTVNRFSTWDLNDHSETIAALTLSGGSVTTGSGTLTLGGNLTSLASATISSISGSLSLGGVTRTFSVGSGTASPDLLVSAIISGMGGAGITKTGAGQLTLSGANTYTGATTIDGFVILANDSALGANGFSTNGTVVNANSYLLVQAVDIGNEFITLAGTVDFRSSGSASWAGPITLNGDVDINVFGGNFTNSGVISGIGGFTKGQSGTLILSGSSGNTYGGAVVVNQGILQLSKSGGQPIPTTADSLTIGDGVGGVDADVVRETGNNQIHINVPITINSSGLLDLNGFSDNLGSLTFDGGHVTTGAGILTLGGNVTVNSSTAAMAVLDGNATLSGTRTINTVGHFYSPDLKINAAVGGAGGLTKDGVGEVSLTAANSYTGVTTVDDGFLEVDNSLALGTTNGGTIVNSGAVLVVRLDSQVGLEALTLAGPGRSGWGALSSDLGSNSWAGAVTLASNATITVYDAAAYLNLSGPVGGAGDLTKTGAGTLIFSGGTGTANSYGATFLNAGTLELAKTISNVAVPGALTIGDGAGGVGVDVVRLTGPVSQIANSYDVVITTSGLLDLNNIYETVGAVSGSGRIDLGSGTLDTGNSGGSSAFSGFIFGSGAVIKNGLGMWTLSGNNTYTGPTTVGAGTLLVDGSQPQSPVSVGSSGTLGGNGTVGIVLGNGNIAPGSSAGCLTTSNLTFSASGDYYVELNGTTPCTGYDQLIVRGTNNLANATLHVTTAFPPGDPASVGDRFIIINNDGAEAVTGTFNGLPDGLEFSAGFYRFRINYGNDVVLTAVGLPISGAATTVTSGNGNHAIDPNECNQLSLAITNQTGTPMTGVSAVLSANTANVMINQPYSTFADVPASGNSTNTTAFQISTLPGLACGSDINLQLAVTTASHGSFIVPITLQSGLPSTTAVRYDNTTVTNVPDIGTIESTNTVAAWSGGPLTKIAVSLWLVAPWDADLNLTLIAPNGASVDLSSGNGAGANFGTGTGDASRTTFDDDAATSITAGTPPFVGTFRPEGSLASLLSGSAIGDWRLRIQDSFGSGSPDTLRAWSLFLYGTTCAAGGGACDFCLPPITGAIDAGDPVQTGRLTRANGIASCGQPKSCPGAYDSVARHYDLYTFTNTSGADACVTVSLTSSCGTEAFAVAYLDTFNPADLCANYLGDAGVSGSAIFSVTVPAGARFVVVVNEVTPNAGCAGYTLNLSGLQCPQPTLLVDPLPSKVRLHWPTWAGGYQLDASTNAVPTAWSAVTNEPIVSGGRLSVTNDTPAPPTKFYRLRKTQ